MTKTILLIAHGKSRDGRTEPLLRAKGYEVEWCCPAQEEALPSDSGAYAGAIVFGGVQSANDAQNIPFLRQEIEWIARFVDTGRPYLGICLGGQLLARALGATVRPHPKGLTEIGYFPVAPTETGGAIFPERLQVYHWHREGFELPGGAELLAQGSTFPNQAFRYGDAAYGLQFHPEVTPVIARRWMESSPDHLTEPGAQPREAQLANAERFDQALHDWFDRFLDHWLSRG